MMTDEQRELQALARDFASAELRPHTAEWDERRELDEEVFTKLADSGFLGMLIPEEHGGLDFDLATYLVVLEELAWGDAAVALSVAIHNGPVAGLIARHGSDAQKEAWLPKLATGEALGAFALSEPDAGSDPSSITTNAVQDGDGWILTGEKRWVTNGARAGVVALFARTGYDAIGLFLVEPSADGYEVGDRETTLGMRASETVSVHLDGVRVGADALVGEVDAGLRYALEALDLGRIGVAAQATGVGRAALEHATRYALERQQFGTPIARFGALQAKLADAAQRIAGGRALTHQAAVAWEATRNGAPRTGLAGVTARAAMAKLAASEAASFTADEAIQIFGGYGYMRHYPVEKLLRDAKGAEIYEGTNEILRRVIAGEILRDAGDR
ncbi:MAG: acyl-CoA dehydrogenase family protein [Longimicrobiales bacterium]|nr:acyl-CoA dehydrogenase family protein [Longimicrobiales bacterium]